MSPAASALVGGRADTDNANGSERVATMDMPAAHRGPSGPAHESSSQVGAHRGPSLPRERPSHPLSAIPAWHPDAFFLLSESGVYLDYHIPDQQQPPIAASPFLNRHLSEVLPPKLARMFLDAIAQARRSESAVELAYAQRVGTEEHHYEARFIAMPHAQVVCIVRDVTSRVRTTAMSQEIARLRSDLAHASRVNLMGRLGPSLVHELKQPLAAVLANANAARRLLSSSAAEASQQIPEIIADIAGGAERARQLIERLLSFARRGESEPESLDMSRVVEEVAVVARPELAFRRVNLELRLARKQTPVFADRVQIQQVVLNLILNAVDAAAARAAHRPLVILRTRHRRDRVLVEVEDNGAGIGRKDLPRLFEPFFSTKKHGLGLGLTIANDIVRAHGGELTAATRKGGAIFRISLPLAHTNLARNSYPRNSHANRGRVIRASDAHLVIAEQIATSRRLGAEILVAELTAAVTLLDTAAKSKQSAVARRAVGIAVGILDFAARIAPRVDPTPLNQQRIDKLRMQLDARLRELNAPPKPAR
jgi:signal transduction histidine kinase